ncbi:MAG: flagellin FliC3 [Lachnospiraceae bacterium]|nr:flagellin FliC3 [Lachnospiraceae bacterium]
MKISYNAAAMRASNALNASDNKVSQSLKRLSSGLKVTASKDNPSGYAIGRRMNTQITGIGTATQSSQNGISVIETADGALTEVHEMLQRMNELYTDNNLVKVDYYADEVMAKVYTIDQMNVVYDAEGRIDKDKTTISLGPEFPKGVEISEVTKTKITLTGPLDFKLTLELSKENMIPGLEVPYEFVDGGVNWEPRLDEDAVKANFTKMLQESGNSAIPKDAEVTGIVRNDAAGTDTIVIENANGFRLEYVCNRPTTTAPNTDPKPDSETVSVDGGTLKPIQDLKIDITGIGTMDIQTGANEGQQLAIRVPTISLNRMDMEDMTMTTSEDCAEANKTIRKAILYVSDARSRLGAYQNRLEHTINNLAVSNENMTASYSRIMDVDMADEMTEYTTEQVISQAAVSMLAQANERPSQVLQLLQ